ncbi:hypothetical protein ACFOUP_01120 [Belliella kenyensis]|uniref:Uncharacterized protein n=1 Tax=Belliella kenyensis TaxID=1472724 RepID=A0ABV8EI86_9BACT|nr:hypothetical protein [Belliella kenyensis]MCH7401702.1 hypothetical protein [Belliella kenyensis]MDN3604202.1 hypothetical protein [Belliella kenyensis]
MKFIILFVLSLLLVVMLSAWLTFPFIMIAIFLLAYVVGSSGISSFFAGGSALALVWFVKAMMISANTQSELPAKMSILMGLNNSFLIFVVTGGLGFVIGSFPALSGALLRNILRKPKGEGWY